jgi:hypothetical protein
LFLPKAPASRSEKYEKLLHRSFMLTLFREVKKVLDGLPVSEFENNEALALAWYDYLEGTLVENCGKSQLYDKVVEKAATVCRHIYVN